jgi:hypothetical protein
VWVSTNSSILSKEFVDEVRDYFIIIPRSNNGFRKIIQILLHERVELKSI